MIKEDKSRVTFNLNGTPQTVFTSQIRRFSDVLREDLGLKGTKVGCDAGDCGACTILINGEQRYACLTATGQLDGSDVRTVEGLSKNGELSALQKSFLEEGAAQCGICTPGMLMAAKSLLDQVPNPSEEQVLEALSGVLCRCTGYTKIVKAVINSGQKQTSISFPDAGNAVGSRMVKVDGQKKLSGEELFGADKAPEGSLWLRTIRSPYARARFSINHPEKALEKYSGLVKVLTADDVPGNNGFGIYPNIKDQPVLAKDHVRFRGEAVAALVGDRESVESVSEKEKM